MYGNIGSPFNLSCDLESRTNTAWYFNNVPLCNVSARLEDCSFQDNVSTSGDGSLLFSPLSFEHAGWYTCAVATREEQGRKERDFLLIVQGICKHGMECHS